MTTTINDLTIALHQAIQANDAKMVLEALEHGADANSRNGYGIAALKYAMTFGNVDVAKALLDHGAKVKDEDILPELAAYGRGGAEMAKLLLEAGADVNERTPGGCTRP